MFFHSRSRCSICPSVPWASNRPTKEAVSTTPELWAKTLDTNLTGGFYVAKAAMPELRRSKGAIVLTASVQGMAAQKGALAYVVAKHGL